ncbi:hypothetical protein [Microvirga sp. CF3016]|uniref:hypothetical protein n=1 Tax=Microvirga sp. CF3016 TaxID=3110181 RepID=UPI002E75A891|nr:hypothetical protein [Microvirga sp. CF3016]MEE1609860.1 hypothetical protein [Microvirga sp. CF3016]
MTVLSSWHLLHRLGHGLTIAALLAGMSLVAFAAGLAFLGALAALPIAVGFSAALQCLRGTFGAPAVGPMCLAPRPTRP